MINLLRHHPFWVLIALELIWLVIATRSLFKKIDKEASAALIGPKNTPKSVQDIDRELSNISSR